MRAQLYLTFPTRGLGVDSVVVKTTPTQTKTRSRLESLEIQTRPRLETSEINTNQTQLVTSILIFIFPFVSTPLGRQQFLSARRLSLWNLSLLCHI